VQALALQTMRVPRRNLRVPLLDSRRLVGAVAPGVKMANVLLVEDEADLLQALKAVLVLDGHSVQTAQDGTDACMATL